MGIKIKQTQTFEAEFDLSSVHVSDLVEELRTRRNYNEIKNNSNTDLILAPQSLLEQMKLESFMKAIENVTLEEVDAFVAGKYKKELTDREELESQIKELEDENSDLEFERDDLNDKLDDLESELRDFKYKAAEFDDMIKNFDVLKPILKKDLYAFSLLDVMKLEVVFSKFNNLTLEQIEERFK